VRAIAEFELVITFLIENAGLDRKGAAANPLIEMNLSLPENVAGSTASELVSKPEPSPFPELTKEERFNGWSPASLAEYKKSRDRACGLVGGNVVTLFVRPKQQPRHENAHSKNYSVFRRKWRD
jgi:hypothetical protein